MLHHVGRCLVCLTFKFCLNAHSQLKSLFLREAPCDSLLPSFLYHKIRFFTMKSSNVLLFFIFIVTRGRKYISYHILTLKDWHWWGNCWFQGILRLRGSSAGETPWSISVMPITGQVKWEEACMPHIYHLFLILQPDLEKMIHISDTALSLACHIFIDLLILSLISPEDWICNSKRIRSHCIKFHCGLQVLNLHFWFKDEIAAY